MVKYRTSVSVAVCTYNGERYIYDQIQSILDQTLPVDEIVICDDGSSDDTISVAESILSKSKIKYKIERNDYNLAITKNFEKCIALCSGDIIFTSDQDDIWQPNKVQKFLDVFQRDKKSVMVFSDASIIDAEGKEVLYSLYKRDGFLQGDISFKSYMDEVLRLNYTVYGCTMAFRREFVMSILPFVESKANHDAWIMCSAGFFGNVTYIPEQLIGYRIHGDNQVGSIAGNKLWDNIVANQDDFDRYFAVQSLRELRVFLIDTALKRFLVPNNEYIKQCRLAISFYNSIISIKRASPINRIWRLTKTIFNKSYHYRICDRGRSLTRLMMVKQFLYDIIFLMKWSEKK